MDYKNTEAALARKRTMEGFAGESFGDVSLADELNKALRQRSNSEQEQVILEE